MPRSSGVACNSLARGTKHPRLQREVSLPARMANHAATQRLVLSHEHPSGCILTAQPCALTSRAPSRSLHLTTSSFSQLHNARLRMLPGLDS